MLIKYEAHCLPPFASLYHISFLFFFIYSTDCEHFDMPVPEFTVADELRNDLDSYEVMWSMYDEFNSGISELAKEDWISFRLVC